MRDNIAILFGFAAIVGCATPLPTLTGQAAPTDAVELFRRARFGELPSSNTGSSISLAHRLRPDWVPQGEDVADWNARVAYRNGDSGAAKAALNGLPRRNQTFKLLTALLENVDPKRPLRETPESPDVIELPLWPEALGLGYPVVEVEIAGRTFRMLWDTGATENVLSVEAAEELDLVQTRVQFPVMRDKAGYVVRFAAAATDGIAMGKWKVGNVPWLVSSLDEVSDLFGDKNERLHGFLSPQLLLRRGCFSVDRVRAQLIIGHGRSPCRRMIAAAESRTPVFSWNGEVYASARVQDSPEVAVQLETGSPVTFLRADATRYLPEFFIPHTRAQAEGNIATELFVSAVLSIGNQHVALAAIDLEPSRNTGGHDDLASVGTDILLGGRGVVVSFATMEMGFMPNIKPTSASAN